MWNLVMGALVSSEDDEGIVGSEDEPQKASLQPEMTGIPATTTGNALYWLEISSKGGHELSALLSLRTANRFCRNCDFLFSFFDCPMSRLL